MGSVATACRLVRPPDPPQRYVPSLLGDVQISVLAPRYYLLSSPSGNLLLYTDDTLSLVAGVQAPALVVAAHHFAPSRGS